MPGGREAELLEAARLALVGRLARAVAHELNNPLFVVLGLVELVLGGLEPGTKPHERLFLAHRTGEEMKGLLRGLLELARGLPDEAAEPVALEDLARASTSTARRLTLAKDVEIRESYDYGTKPATVLVRRAQVDQLLLVLLVDAQTRAAGVGGVAVEVRRTPAHAVAAVATPPGARPLTLTAVELEGATLLAAANGGELVVGAAVAEVVLPLAG